MRFLKTLAAAIVLFPQTLAAQLNVNTGLSPQQLVQDHLLGAGVQVSNVSITGHPRQFAQFSNSNSNLQLNSGVMLCTGYANDISVNNNNNGAFSSVDPNCTMGAGGICQEGDDDLDFILGDSITNDAAVLEFDFIPEADTVRFRYVFASEEYNEYVCSNFNDIFAFIVTGPGISGVNIARIPNANFPVAINTVNNGQPGTFGNQGNCSAPFGSLNFSQYFVDNTSGAFVEFDGMTVAFTAVAAVRPCETYHIKLVVADVSDAAYDSGVFLEAGSFSSVDLDAFAVINKDTVIAEGCNNGTVTFELENAFPFDYVIPFTLTGSATNNVDYTGVPDTLIIPAGINSASFSVTAFADSITEGLETIVIYYLKTACASEYDSLIIKINEEIILPAPDSLFCESFTNTQISFGWTAVAGASNYEVSTDQGANWYTASPGLLTHNANRAHPNEPIMLYVRAIGGTPGCGDNEMDSILCYTCGLEVSLDSVYHLPCDGSPQGAIDISVAGGFTPYNFVWSNGDDTEDISDLQAGVYTVTITDALDCQAFTGSNIQASPIPDSLVAYIFELGRDEYSIALGDVVMAGIEQPQAGISYDWSVVGGDPNLAGLNETNGSPINILPTENGVYTYQVVASINSFGTICTDSATVNLVVTGFLGVPTAFTPNGDGLNDRFRPVHLSAAEVIEFQIFDRWGQLLYSDPDISDGGWDGYYRNEAQPREVYLYVIQFQEAGSSQVITARGEFTLIR